MNKNILITGANGFLGSYLSQKFSLEGFKVFALVRENSDLFRLQGFIKNIQLVTVEKNNLEDLFSKNSINFVIHTATAYGRSGESIEEIKEVNTNLPSKLWDLARQYEAKMFVNTDTFMPANTSMEDKYFNYCRTKKDFLEYAQNNLSKQTKFVNLVIYHMFGPKDNPTKFLPVMIKRLLNNEKEIDLTPGDQKRDFVFINDVCEAFGKCIQNAEMFNNYEEFSIGSGKDNSIKEIILYIKEYLKSTAVLNWGALPYPPGEVMFSSANVSKNSKLDWAVKTSVFEGLNETIEYYKKQ